MTQAPSHSTSLPSLCSVNLYLLFGDATDCPGASESPAWRVVEFEGRGVEWTVPVPESVKVLPPIGRNSQSYDVG